MYPNIEWSIYRSVTWIVTIVWNFTSKTIKVSLVVFPILMVIVMYGHLYARVCATWQYTAVNQMVAYMPYWCISMAWYWSLDLSSIWHGRNQIWPDLDTFVLNLWNFEGFESEIISYLPSSLSQGHRQNIQISNWTCCHKSEHLDIKSSYILIIWIIFALLD